MIWTRTIAISVRCRICGREVMTEFPEIVLATALNRWNHLVLYSSCHDGTWEASEEEISKLRAYVGVEWIEAHKASPA